MEVINIIAIIGIFICSVSTFTIIIKYFIENDIFFIRRRRSNRISPEMFVILSSLIQERNRIYEQKYQEEERQREIELTEMRNRNNDTVIIINPNNNIQLGQSKIIK
tara:strand:- start:133 stop:453 length:321 start_codon:yes stop_codon:yes gene_type:complete